MTLPSLVLLVAFAVAAVSLVRARIGIGSVRQRQFAPPRGDSAAGIRYAFTTAFLPWTKESASRHLPTYLAGIVYHAGIFGMLARLVLTLVVRGRLGWIEYDLAALWAASLVCGVALCAKRGVDRTLRTISVPDDYVSNLLVDAALAGAIAAALRPALLPVFQLAGATLLFYAPLGKLRHMLFLLTSRRLWGEFYGRRGVLP